MNKKILVVYYSRTGHTRRVAEEIAAILRADVEEIVDPEDRMGILGYFRSGRQAFFGHEADIREPLKDPAVYDLVIVGTPVWNWSLSAPARAYLARRQQRLARPPVAFFLTHGGSGAPRVLGQMEELLGKAPLDVMAVREAEIANGRYHEKIRSFTESLADRLSRVRTAA
jgi:flavodoxin